jgi:sterol 3beta-glucosyltransferase
VLRVMINDNEHHQTPDHVGREAATPTAPDPTDIEPPGSPSNMPLIKENVRATLSPRSARHVGRASMSDASARSSVDAPRKSWDGRRSTDGSHAVLHTSHETRKSFRESRREPHPSNLPKDRSTSSQRVVDSESTTTSIEPGTESSAAIQSMDESNASASQILDRSDVFRAPAAHSHMPASDQAGLHVRSSHDTTALLGPRGRNNDNTQKRYPENPARQLSLLTRQRLMMTHFLARILRGCQALHPRYRISPPIRSTKHLGLPVSSELGLRR